MLATQHWKRTCSWCWNALLLNIRLFLWSHSRWSGYWWATITFDLSFVFVSISFIVVASVSNGQPSVVGWHLEQSKRSPLRHTRWIVLLPLKLSACTRASIFVILKFIFAFAIVFSHKLNCLTSTYANNERHGKAIFVPLFLRHLLRVHAP